MTHMEHGTAGLPEGAGDRLNSMNSALIIHRVGRVNPDFVDEARKFSADLTGYMNGRLNYQIATRLLEEPGAQDPRLHWLVHLKTPADYSQLLNMVDHDKAFRDIYHSDRLPQRGGGNWERMFVQGSFHETVLLPQHGFAWHDVDQGEPNGFIPPALHQIAGPKQDLLHSQNAGAIVIRTFHAMYESRDLARLYLHEWQEIAHRKYSHILTCGQYELIWGYQDRLSLMIHLRSPEDYQTLLQADDADPDIAALNAKPRVNLHGHERTWTALFEAGSPDDIVLRPIDLL